jgi:hypothetical protein
MERLRALVLSLATAALLAACNPSQPTATAANPLAGDPNVDGWARVRSADINIPRGVSYTTTNVGGATVAEISRVPENAVSTSKTGGVSIRVPVEVEARASGGSVRVVVRAYAQQGGSSFGVAYSTNDVGNSGWLQFPLTEIPTDYVLVYAVPRMNGGNGDYLGFRSYGAASVHIVGFRVEAIPAPAPAVSTQLRPTSNSATTP